MSMSDRPRIKSSLDVLGQYDKMIAGIFLCDTAQKLYQYCIEHDNLYDACVVALCDMGSVNIAEADAKEALDSYNELVFTLWLDIHKAEQDNFFQLFGESESDGDNV
jgi:hypothetical protein